MNMELIRKQLEEINPPEIEIKQNVLHQIRIRKQKRKRRVQISAAVALLVVIIGTLQFQQITAMAEHVYRSIQLSLKNEILIFDNRLEMIPIEVHGLTWVGKKPNRVGYKRYTDIHAALDELKINPLQNTISTESLVVFTYFEKRNVAELLLHHYFIGDLKNYSETILENGDREYRYSTDDTVYKSPVNMKVSFFTGRGANHEMDNLDNYDYEEKYISPVNGITAYLLKNTFQAESEEKSLLMYAAGTITDKMTVFVHDNLLYTIYGNIPSPEMKKIIDSFVIEK